MISGMATAADLDVVIANSGRDLAYEDNFIRRAFYELEALTTIRL